MRCSPVFDTTPPEYVSLPLATMYSYDVFAVVTAHDQKNKSSSALVLDHNSRWFRKAIGGVALEPTMENRETTPAEDSQLDDEKKEEIASNVNRLVVSFSELLDMDNLENGLQLGTNPLLSHILLRCRGTKGISGRQVSSRLLLCLASDQPKV